MRKVEERRDFARGYAGAARGRGCGRHAVPVTAGHDTPVTAARPAGHRGPLRWAILTSGVCGLALLAGCADSGPWPKASDFTRIEQRTLTPAEQQQAIEGMTSKQQAEQQKALKRIEGSKTP